MQYCMPTDSPHLSKQLKPLAVAMSPVLWSRFKPDRFDSFSCGELLALFILPTHDYSPLPIAMTLRQIIKHQDSGKCHIECPMEHTSWSRLCRDQSSKQMHYAGLVLMQLALPKLRSSTSIKKFNNQLKEHRYDLMSWQESERLSARDTALLDANYGAGWNLAEALLRPRNIQVPSICLVSKARTMLRHVCILWWPCECISRGDISERRVSNNKASWWCLTNHF